MPNLRSAISLLFQMQGVFIETLTFAECRMTRKRVTRYWMLAKNPIEPTPLGGAEFSRMSRVSIWLVVVSLLAVSTTGRAATGRVVKVLPEFMDLKGRTSLSASLYERDAYQATLRDHPERRSGMRFYVEWKTKGPIWEPLTVRVELRGAASGNLPKLLVLEQRAENKGGLFSHWTNITLNSADYKNIGSVTAWRVTFWEGTTLLGHQESFLW